MIDFLRRLGRWFWPLPAPSEPCPYCSDAEPLILWPMDPDEQGGGGSSSAPAYALAIGGLPAADGASEPRKWCTP